MTTRELFSFLSLCICLLHEWISSLFKGNGFDLYTTHAFIRDGSKAALIIIVIQGFSLTVTADPQRYYLLKSQGSDLKGIHTQSTRVLYGYSYFDSLMLY